MFKPTPADIEWQKRMIAILNNGGVWAVPRCGTIYQVDHDKKTMTITAGEGEEAIHETIEAAGYAVILGSGHRYISKK